MTDLPYLATHPGIVAYGPVVRTQVERALLPHEAALISVWWVVFAVVHVVVLYRAVALPFMHRRAAR